jgi:hypothetical protein
MSSADRVAGELGKEGRAGCYCGTNIQLCSTPHLHNISH